ncbi:MAG: hypothetical protein ABEJ74_00190 [Haloferacaceae archaeon]
MPTIEISDAQLEALEELRTHIAAEHVGPYGHVRFQEVVQFLLDRHESGSSADREAARAMARDLLADRSYQQLQSLAAAMDGVEPGGKAPDLRDRLVEAAVERFFGDDGPTAAGAESSESHPPSDESSNGDDSANRDEPDPEGHGESDDAGDETDDRRGTPETDEGSDDGPADQGASRLERMMGLLDRHADAWEETDGEEGKYAVTLPDGSVESVRTKDDVRALLFKHYD